MENVDGMTNKLRQTFSCFGLLENADLFLLPVAREGEIHTHADPVYDVTDTDCWGKRKEEKKKKRRRRKQKKKKKKKIKRRRRKKPQEEHHHHHQQQQKRRRTRRTSTTNKQTNIKSSSIHSRVFATFKRGYLTSRIRHGVKKVLCDYCLFHSYRKPRDASSPPFSFNVRCRNCITLSLTVSSHFWCSFLPRTVSSKGQRVQTLLLLRTLTLEFARSWNLGWK